MNEQTHDVTASKNIFGFWIYLMTDCVLFGTLFATFVVLRNGAHSGPTSQELFNLPYVLLETMVLLASSFVCGLSLLAVRNKQINKAALGFVVTLILGSIFLGLEINEFSHLVAEGYGWQVNGFLSAYFTLVGTHGLHILFGLIWLLVLVIKIAKNGIGTKNQHQLIMLGIFWHFLDIIWIFIFTIVYMLGVGA